MKSSLSMVKRVLVFVLLCASFGCFLFGNFIKIDMGEEWNRAIDTITEPIEDLNRMLNSEEAGSLEGQDKEIADKTKEVLDSANDFLDNMRSGEISYFRIGTALISVRALVKTAEEIGVADKEIKEINTMLTIAMVVILVIVGLGLICLILSAINIFKDKGIGAYLGYSIFVFVVNFLLVFVMQKKIPDGSHMTILVGIPYYVMLILSICSVIVWKIFESMITKAKAKEWVEESKNSPLLNGAEWDDK